MVVFPCVCWTLTLAPGDCLVVTARLGLLYRLSFVPRSVACDAIYTRYQLAVPIDRGAAERVHDVHWGLGNDGPLVDCWIPDSNVILYVYNKEPPKKYRR